jgi:threonine dehydratase
MWILIDFVQIEEAFQRISGIANNTPVMTSRALNEQVESSAFLKCENFQRTGSFKFRGAYNALSLLSDEKRTQGVIAHSSGNHAQAMALCARLFDIPCVVVMPSNSSQVKIDAVKGYGAKIIMCNPSLEARIKTTEKFIAQNDYTLIHPYNNDNVIAGAGTASYELVSKVKELDYIFCPIGGGGLISGTSIAAKNLLSEIKVIGVEPELANDAYISFTTGKLVPNINTETVADGLRTSLSKRTFDIIRRNVDEIVLVSEKEIIDAMRFLWERMKLVVEPSGAVSLAGFLKAKMDAKGRKVGVILSGGNVDLAGFFKSYGI